MNTITDKSQIDRLNEKGIIIEDIFLRYDKKFIRKSDGSRLDQVFNASRIQKKYYYNNKCIYKEKNFNKNSNYTFATYSKDNKLVCPNCGNEGNSNEFFEGCPYCDTSFNIDYQLKRYNFNPIKDTFDIRWFKFITGVVAIIMPIVLNYIVNKDWRIALLTILLFPISYTLTYFILSLLLAPFIFVNGIITTYRESSKIRNGEIDRNKIINSLVYELKQYYFNDKKYKDLIDFDILTYYYIYTKTINNELYVEIKYKIRKYYFKNKRINKKINVEKVMLKYNNKHIDKKNNIIMCDNCGASIDITKKHCEYCNTKVKNMQKWILIK